ncbi:zinc ribbon domain-containing protein [Amycolatopsis sp. NPDC003865]
MAVVATAGVTTFALTRGPDPAPPDATAAATVVPAVTTTAQPLTQPETVPMSTVAPLVTEADLRRQVTGDSAVAESIVGQWVPQLSSKSLGLVVGGVTYDYPAIMADFRRLHDRFPDAIMVNSGDFRNFSRREFWVTLEPAVFPTADAANTWCDEQSFAREDCHASRLTHTGGPAGNSKPR